jgi:hypothetical protein
MADKRNSDRNQDQEESIAGASEEQMRGVPGDDDSFDDTADDLADDEEEDEEGGTF